MKIKELFENNNNDYMLHLVYDVFGVNNTKFEFIIQKFIESIPQCTLTNYDFTHDNNFNIEITLSFDFAFNKAKIEKIQTDITNKIFSLCDDSSFSSTIWLYSLPSTLIEWNSIKLAGAIKSLHDIHQKIKCRELEIGFSYAIKDSVLGLLKIDKVKVIFGNSHNTTYNSNVSNWVAIMRTYLIGTRDVWKCQDELQDLDLDEYAQL